MRGFVFQGSFVVFLALLLFSCAKDELDFDKINVEGNLINRSTKWVMPVVYTDLSLADYAILTPGSFLTVDGVGNYAIAIRDTIYKGQAIDYFQDISGGSTSIGLPLSSIPTTATKTLDTFVDVDITTSPNSVELKEISLSSGLATLEVVNNTDAPLRFEFALPSLSDSRILTFDVPPGQTTPQTLDLSNFLIYLGRDQTQKYNRVRIGMTMTNLKTLEEAPIGTSSLSISFSNTTWSFVRGYFGRVTTAVSPIIQQTRVESILGDANVVVKDAFPLGSYYELQTINQMGIPFYADMSLDFYRPNDNLFLAPFRSLAMRLFNQYPTIDMRGQSTNFTRRYGENKSLDTIISLSPNRFFTSGLVLTNEGRSPTSDTNQFVESSSQYTAIGTLFVPFKFLEMDTVYIENELHTSIGKIDTSTFVVDTAILNIQGSNYFPSEVYIELFLVDASGKHYDTLSIKDPIAAASVDALGVVSKETAFKTSLTLSKTEIESLEKLDDLVVRAYLKRKLESTPATFSSNNYIKVGVGIEATVRLKL